jgi:hypothetical protein
VRGCQPPPACCSAGHCTFACWRVRLRWWLHHTEWRPSASPLFQYAWDWHRLTWSKSLGHLSNHSQGCRGVSVSVYVC